MKKIYTPKIVLYSVFIKTILFSLFLLFISACQMSKEEKIQEAFLKDSLQYEQTKFLKQANQNKIEIDTALNNPNSKDAAIPVFEE